MAGAVAPTVHAITGRGTNGAAAVNRSNGREELTAAVTVIRHHAVLVTKIS